MNIISEGGCVFAVIATLLCSAAVAQVPDSPQQTIGGARLSVGDPAPALEVSEWLKGDAIAAFDAREVYIIEFWAAWCGPCKQAMGHLSHLEKTYGDKGLRIIGLTAINAKNTMEQVKACLERRASTISYRMAADQDDRTWRAFMLAAGQRSIPCSFVIGHDGKIAYIGHPAMLDIVVPKVVDGTWRGVADVEEMSVRGMELNEIQLAASGDVDGALARFSAFGVQHPEYRAFAEERRMYVLMGAERWDEAVAAADARIAAATEEHDSGDLTMLAARWMDQRWNPGKKRPDVPVRAARAALAIVGEKDHEAFIAYADACAGNAEHSAAAEAYGKALPLMDEGPYKGTIIKRQAENAAKATAAP